MRTAKTLIRLGECPGWSESSLGAHAILLVLSWGSSFVRCFAKKKGLTYNSKCLLHQIFEEFCKWYQSTKIKIRKMWERGGSVVECRTPEREVRGSRPTAAVLCPWARHFTPRKYWLITQEAMAPSRHDWKIVDWDVKPQHNQPTAKCSTTFDECWTTHGIDNWAATWQNQQCGYVPSEDSDQPGHPPSLIRVFAVRKKKAWILSYPLNAQRRLRSDWADAQADLSLHWAHTHFVGFVMSRLNCS